MSIKNILFSTNPKSSAPLFLRLALASVFIIHGSQKLFGAWGGPGLKNLGAYLETIHFAPGLLWAILLALSEFLGGILVLVGFATRIAALAIFVTMLMAILTVHNSAFLLQNNGMEYALTLALVSLSLIVSGAGRLSLDNALFPITTGTSTEP